MRNRFCPRLFEGVIVALLCMLLFPQHIFAQKRQRPKSQGQTRERARESRSNEASAQGQQTSSPAAQQINSSIRVRWRGQPGVERYRLQVARDQAFSDIIFDQAVTGREHLVSLPSGNYFWRVAPAVNETGTYSSPQPVEINSSSSVADEKSVLTGGGGSGWRTATGETPNPIALRLRPGGGFDFVAVNMDGMVYAIDGMNGVAMWTARYNLAAKQGVPTSTSKTFPFVPLAITDADGKQNVVVAFEGGLRALRGETGRELWRSPFAGRAGAGFVAVSNTDGKSKLLVLTLEPNSLVVIEAETGAIISTTKLEGRPVGSPSAFGQGAEQAVVIGYMDGSMEARRTSGEIIHTVKLDSAITTSPLVLQTARALIIVIGTEKGLFALNATDLKILGKIDTGGDTPTGQLIASDIDNDGNAEIVMVTLGGRVALINTTDGKIRWVAEGAREANSAALADLDGDGVLDVITAAGTSFAHGFSGRDGSLIWRVEEEGMGRSPAAPVNPSPRALVVAPTNASGAFLVGGDPSRIGLRAVELPKGAVKTAQN